MRCMVTLVLAVDGFQSDLVCTICMPFLQIGESGWAPPLPRESSDSSSQADDMNTKPVLLRAQIPECTDPLCMKWWPE